jgi:hypothetical protein
MYKALCAQRSDHVAHMQSAHMHKHLHMRSLRRQVLMIGSHSTSSSFITSQAVSIARLSQLVYTTSNCAREPRDRGRDQHRDNR